MILPRPRANAELAPAWMQVLPSIGGIGRLQGLVGLLVSCKWREQAIALLTEPGDQVTACDLFELYFHRLSKQSELYNYFVFRFGQPRHLVALSFASLIHHPQNQSWTWVAVLGTSLGICFNELKGNQS